MSDMCVWLEGRERGARSSEGGAKRKKTVARTGEKRRKLFAPCQ